MVHNNFWSCYYNNDPTQIMRKTIFDKYNIHFSVGMTPRPKLRSLKDEFRETRI
jgi:hypothetical protein